MSTAPKLLFRPQTPNIPVRPGVSMDGIHPDTQKVLDAVTALGLDGLEITSGFRDPNRNASAGGAKGSQHIHGRALDFNWGKLSEAQRQQVLDAAIAAGGRGIGIYPGGNAFHIDTRETPAAWGPNGYRGSPVFGNFCRTCHRPDIHCLTNPTGNKAVRPAPHVLRDAIFGRTMARGEGL